MRPNSDCTAGKHEWSHSDRKTKVNQACNTGSAATVHLSFHLHILTRWQLKQCSMKTRNMCRHRRSSTPATTAAFTSNRATVTFCVTVWPWPLSFWHHFLSMAITTAMDYMRTNFGVDSSIRFPFRARTHGHAQSQNTQLIAFFTTRLPTAYDN